MKIKDSVFGELEYDYVWSKDMQINFLGKEIGISFIVKGDEDGKFDNEQYVAYKLLMQNWEDVQRSLLQPILDYYNQKRYELGYDTSYNENYPHIETTDQLVEMISMDGIVIPMATSMKREILEYFLIVHGTSKMG